MKPLVEATVADATGVMKATFFNQPWLERQYRPGTRLMLTGKYQARNRFRVNAPRADRVGRPASATTAATYPATKGITSTQILALVREHRAAVADVAEPLPGAPAASQERLPDRRGRGRPPRTSATARPGGARLAFDELLLDQVVQLRLRAERRVDHAAPSR